MILLWIKKGVFRKIVDKLLSNRSEFCRDGMDFSFDINYDDDPVNKAKRENWFLKKRMLILRSAKKADDELDFAMPT